MDNNLSLFLDTFTSISKKPHEFLSVQEDAAESVKPLVKQIFDYTKCNEILKYKDALPNLIIDSCDEEQIWQQLELQNGSCTNDVIQSVPKLSANKYKLEFPIKLKCNSKKKIEKEENNKQAKRGNNYTEEINPDIEDEFEDKENEDDIDEEDENEGMDEDDLFEDTSKENESEKTYKKKGKLKPSVVDDKFFKLSELELFLQHEEKNEDKPGKESDVIDLFNNDDDGNTSYKYSDFFEEPEDEPKSNKNIEMEGEEDDLDRNEMDDEDNSEPNENDDEDESDIDESIEKSAVKGSKRKHDEEMSEEEGDEKDEKGKKKRVRFDLLGSDESDDDSQDNLIAAKKKVKEKGEPTIKSTLEQRQERLGRMIEKLEEEALSEKPWQLTGEVSATARPQNSLLEEAVDFDLSVRPAPIITGEVSLRLEDIIMQRIKDKAWDDVERKVKPVDTPSEFKKKLALDQEKSKLSLAEVYEQEFVKQREAATADDTERLETEPALYVEVRSLLSSLFNKLDALSNYHYTPRPVAPELKVVSNVAAISMEEVAPVSVADSMLLAPEEIKGKKRKSLLMSKDERTDTDKKRARRLKKTRQRQRQRENAKTGKETTKINAGLGIKFGKQKGEKTMGSGNNKITKMEESNEKTIRSSSAFFNKLQDEVKSQIKSKTSFVKKKEKHNITAKKLKL